MKGKVAAERWELPKQDSDSAVHTTQMKRATGQHLKQPAWPDRQLSQALRSQKDTWEGPEPGTWHRIEKGEKGLEGKGPGHLKSQNEPCSQKREKESHEKPKKGDF